MSFPAGYIKRDYSAQPLGSIPYTVPFDLKPIPKSEWKDRIDYRREQKSRLVDVVEAAGIQAGNQNGFGSCWAWGCSTAFIVARAAAGLPYVHLNPHALFALVKNFHDQGGNTFDAIPWLAENGIPSVNTWPLLSMDRSLATSTAVKEDAAKYRLTEHWELEPNNFEQKATCLLSGIPVGAGYLHLGHLMCDIDLIYRGSGRSIEFGVEFINSYGPTWNGNGRGQLWDRKAVSFDQAAPRCSTVNDLP